MANWEMLRSDHQGKGGFFSESAMCFLNLQISKKIFQKTNLNLKLKFQAQDRFLEYFYFGDLKNDLHFLKKGHL